MSAAPRIMLAGLLLGSALAFCGCQEGTPSSGSFQYLPLFGDGTNDVTPVIAKVGDVEITENQLDLWIDELPAPKRSKYQGPDGRRLALKTMVEAVLMVNGAVEQKLYLDQDVARMLISLRRNTLDTAMRNYGLLRGQEPTEEQVRQFFTDNRDKYRHLGIVHARHIATDSEEKAREVYSRLLEGGKGNSFPELARDYSVNIETRKQEGDLGWFNRGGFIAHIRNSQVFSAKAFDLENGLNPPISVSDRWHVIEILNRENERPQTYAEARDQVVNDMLPGFQDAIIKDYLLDAREKYGLEMFGEFAPGRGLTADELFVRAMAVADAENKLELFNLLHTDYPTSDRADDALFMAAQVTIETYEDMRIAERYLNMLIRQYPDSELVDDATYLRDNLYNPKVIRPMRIEDLRQ
ncbi:MAG: peptidyl-prolyl cis-trans isomerase [bacterium]